MNVKLLVQYDGTRYDGWQRQKNTANTIQGKLEEVLGRMTGSPCDVNGAGRTDAGVHALGQIANVHLSDTAAPEEVKAYLNRYLPEDIAIADACEVPERFHSRLSAKGKFYRYRIGLPGAKNVFERRQIYPCDFSLDVDAMRKTASFLTGEHDFLGFCANKHMKKSSARNVWRIEIQEKPGELELNFLGDGFLYNMIRILTGTLIEAGQGVRAPESVLPVFEQRDRSLAGFTAPARGLTLMEVFYPADRLQ